MSETICWCCTCTVAECTCAGGRDPDKRIDCDGEHTCAQSGCSRYDRPKPDLLPKAETLPTDCYDFGADADTNAQLVQCAQSFLIGRVQQCMAAKQAHDLTAKCKVGCWGQWCSAVGISRDTGESYVRIAELFGNIELNGKPLIEALPITLLYAAAKPSAPPELVERVKKGEIATHRAYQAERDALLTRAEQAERAEAAAKADLQTERDGRAADKQQIAQLQAENRELQKRPVAEVLPPDPAEIDRLVDARIKAARQPPTPDEIMAIYGRMQRYTAAARDQWDTLRPQLPVLPPDMRQSFCRGLREALAHIIRELSEEEVRPCRP